MSYARLEHSADLKIRAEGPDLKAVFVDSARAMMDYIFGGRIKPPPSPAFRSRLELYAPDRGALLVEWLSRLLLSSASDYNAAVDFAVEVVDETRLRAEIGWVPAEAEEEIKAVTFHELELEPFQGGWQATVIYDL